MTLFQKLDMIRAKVDAHRNEPLFSEEVASLKRRHQETITKEGNNLLRVMAKLIAYSNNAPSNKVTELIEGPHFERIFHDFDIAAVADDDAERLIELEWHNLTAFRFKKKVPAIIKCAKILRKNNIATIDSLISKHRVPVELKSEKDVEMFWLQFESVLAEYERQEMPHFKNMTTLLHLLLHLGFPCVKPDLIVMKVAASIGIVNRRTNHNAYRPNERKLVVRTIQNYCLTKNLNPVVMDLYFLIYGGQKDSVKYAKGLVPI